MFEKQKKKAKVWFYQTDMREEASSEERPYHLSRSPKDSQMTDDERVDDNIRQQVNENTSMTHENRTRIVRIDERTAFIARIIFALFIGFLVTLAGGIAVSLLQM